MYLLGKGQSVVLLSRQLHGITRLQQAFGKLLEEALVHTMPVEVPGSSVGGANDDSAKVHQRLHYAHQADGRERVINLNKSKQSQP